MKGVIINTKNKYEVRDFGAPLYKTVGEAVRGSIEIVHPSGLTRPYVMIVNDEGRLMNLPGNLFGSLLYGTPTHGEPIVGDIVIMKEGMTPDGPDIVGLDDDEVRNVITGFEAMIASYNTVFEEGGDNA